MKKLKEQRRYCKTDQYTCGSPRKRRGEGRKREIDRKRDRGGRRWRKGEGERKGRGRKKFEKNTG